MGDMQDALAVFARVEANLDKIEQVWHQIRSAIPERGPAFGLDIAELKALRLAFEDLCRGLPPIDGYYIDPASVLEPDVIAGGRLEAMEIGHELGFEEAVYLPQELIDGYRVRLARERRALAAGQIRAVVATIDEMLETVDLENARWSGGFGWPDLQRSVRELEQLVGGLVERRGRWSDLHRHLHFAMANDLVDIVGMDWPSVRESLEPVMFNDREPLPVDASMDLASLARSRPARPSAGPQPLAWRQLDDEQFERLIFNLLQRTEGYEDVSWLMNTRAADRGRDIQAFLFVADPLMPTRRQRIIVQCKHWQSRSVNVEEVAKVLAQVKLWEPPLVEIVIIASSGRFSADAVAFIERQEESRVVPRIVMLADSQIETMLSQHQGLIAEFGLR